MISSLLERKIEKRPDKVRLQGRILFLTEEAELIKRQLAGEDLPWDTENPVNNPKLRDDISTDEITPAHYCFYFDQTLGEIPYAGLKTGGVLPIGRGDVKRGGFVCSVTPYATCPLAPKENRLALALPVGEKYDHKGGHH